MTAGKRIGIAVSAWVLAAGCDHPDAPPQVTLSETLSVGADAAGFKKAAQPRPFAFPRDHGPHPAFRNEWWYLTAVLATPAGREFGVQFTVFRHGLEPVDHAALTAPGAAAWRTGQVYMAHVAVSDVTARRHHEDERLSRGHPALARATAAPFEVAVEGWRLGSRQPANGGAADAFWPLRVHASTAGFGYDLTLAGGKPIVLQGDRGLSRKGPGSASYYYSIVRIAASGEITLAGQTHAVSGAAWLDREWSTGALSAEQAGWDWFALQLRDGREVMLYRMRRADGARSPFDAGTLVDATGQARTLGPDAFSLRPARHWRGWPVVWQVALDSEATPWTVRAAFDDQVMDTSIRYWEGVVHVYDGAGQRIGAGYMEMTGTSG